MSTRLNVILRLTSKLIWWTICPPVIEEEIDPCKKAVIIMVGCHNIVTPWVPSIPFSCLRRESYRLILYKRSSHIDSIPIVIL